MIYNGFQARILDVNHEPLAEVMPEPEVRDIKPTPTPSLAGSRSILEEYTAKFGQKIVKEYKSSLRKEAIQNVRCGAVRVKVDDESEDTATLSPFSNKKVRTTKLFLAFRWVGTDHRNAARAHELEELQHTILPILHGKGLQQEEEEQSKSSLLAVADSTTTKGTDSLDKKSDRKKYKLFGRLKLGEKGREIEKAILIRGQPLPRYRTFSLRTKKSIEESHPFLLQLCVNEKVIPLRKNAWTSNLCENDGVFIVWLSEGAMIDLGRICISLNDLKDVQTKTVQSVTLHLWDAMRKELWSNAVTFTMTGTSGLVYPTCDIRSISPPNAILHFNIIAIKETNNVQPTNPTEEEEEEVPNEPPQPIEHNNSLTRSDNALAIVIETSQEHSLNSAMEGTSEHTVEDEIAGESTPRGVNDGSTNEATSSSETHLPRTSGVIPERRSSLGNRSRTNSLQATVQTTQDRSNQPISQLFEEVDRLRFEHEHLKDSLSALDGQWRNSVLVELQKIKGEIRDRVEIDREYYNKLKKRFSVPPEAYSQLNK